PRVAARGGHDDAPAAPDGLPRRRQEPTALALREPDANGEILVLAVSESHQAVAQADDGRRRPPGFGQRADLNQTGGSLSQGQVAAQSEEGQGESQRQTTDARKHHRSGDGSASRA